jgi:hypothetical protein
VPLPRRFSGRGRATWLLAAAAAGAFGLLVAVLRGDWTGAILIALVVVLLVASWLWGKVGGE